MSVHLPDCGNLSAILRRFNISEEDLDYVTSLDPPSSPGLGDGDDGGINCYCPETMHALAERYRLYHGYVALVVCVFGTLANVLNIVVLTSKDMRVTPINRILTGLASADVLVMIEYIPFSIYVYLVLPERKAYPLGWAVFVLFHMHFTQLFHTISIALTLTLAIWRYIAIRFPQYSRDWCTKSRCRWALTLSFLLPIIACLPSYFVFGIKERAFCEHGKRVVLYHVDSDYELNKGLLYRLNFWIIGVMVKILPCILLTIISWWLIRALYRAKGRKRLLRGFDTTGTVAPSGGATGICSAAGHNKVANKSERRADRTTRMLVAVLLLFLITEIPQGVLNLASALLGDCFFRHCYHSFGEVLDILALLNGAINFILYCSMSKQFRTAFGQLLRPSLLAKPSQHQPTQQTDVQSTYV